MFDALATQPPETDPILHLTGITWTAIGSIISAVSILFLCFFNWISMKVAERSANSVSEQAAAAQKSLSAIERRSFQDSLMLKGAAIDSLNFLIAIVAMKIPMIQLEAPMIDGRLFPNSWLDFTQFTTLQSVEFKKIARGFVREVHQTEIMLTKYNFKPYAFRSQENEDTISVRNSLEHVVDRAEQILKILEAEE